MRRRALLLALHLGVGLGILLAVSAGTSSTTSAGTTTSFPTDPAALDYYDRLRELIPPSSISRTDVIEVDVGALQALHSPSSSASATATPAVNESFAAQTTQTGENGTSSPSTIRLRHLAVFLTLRDDILAGAFDIAAAAILAAHHFNNGIADVVPQLADEAQKSCQIRYTLEYFSTQFEPRRIQRLYLDEENILPLTTNVAADVLLNDLFRRTAYPNPEPDPTRPAPTGLLGPVFSEQAVILAEMAGVDPARSLPLISPLSETFELDNKNRYPTFGRTVPAVGTDAYALVDFLVDNLNCTHFGVLLDLDADFSSTYITTFQEAAANRGVTVQVSTYVGKEFSLAALKQLKASDYRYIYAQIQTNDFVDIMKSATNLGITGEDYFWLFSEGDLFRNPTTKEPIEYPQSIADAVSGSALIESTFGVGLEGNRGWDAMRESWEETLTTPEAQRYFDSKMPDEVRNISNYADLSNLSTIRISHYAHLMFDAFMALALASCDAENETTSDVFDTRELYASFLKSDFNGAYGMTQINKKTGSRDYRTVPYTLSNVMVGPSVFSETGFSNPNQPTAPLPIGEDGGDKTLDNTTITFSLTRTHNFVHSHKGSGHEGMIMSTSWVAIEGVPFLYSDGTTKPPLFLPPLEVYEIEDYAYITGFVLSSICLSLAIGFGIWTAVRRKSKVVRASQPIFLGMLCAGAFVLASTMIPLSLADFPEETLAQLCTSVPWLFSTGMVTSLSALISKTLRVYRVASSSAKHKRITVKPQHVLPPFVLLSVANLIVLTAWTIMSPVTYGDIQLDSVDAFGRPITFGSCFDERSDVDVIFLVLVAAINLSAAFAALILAYKTRRVMMEYNESSYIFITLLSIFQAFVICVPFVFVVNPTWQYMLWHMMITAIALSILLPVFIPKIRFHRRWLEKEAEKAQRKEERKKRQTQFRQQVEDSAKADPLPLPDPGSSVEDRGDTIVSLNESSAVGASGVGEGIKLLEPNNMVMGSTGSGVLIGGHLRQGSVSVLRPEQSYRVSKDGTKSVMMPVIYEAPSADASSDHNRLSFLPSSHKTSFRMKKWRESFRKSSPQF